MDFWFQRKQAQTHCLNSILISLLQFIMEKVLIGIGRQIVCLSGFLMNGGYFAHFIHELNSSQRYTMASVNDE